MDCLDCVSTTARLHLYIDRELSAEEVTVVQQHLDGCPSCESRFIFDTHLKRLIHERCTIEHAPHHLRDAVMRLAHGELLAIDPELEKEIAAELKNDMRKS
ncbi:MAG TPA: mycothiol system anti-sigma-R factor [Dictyobacter sp.]|jgi:mycothiol system anti-sigma-R factor|nr:mycothiol system anti-sigma-R factor [Dictyobacter sp.]